MPFYNLIKRPTYHKNGLTWFGKFTCSVIGEGRYEWFRLEKRIRYAQFWYIKQNILFRFQQQYPYFAQWFSLLNKADTSTGFPAKRQYERHNDFAVFNVNGEGWFQLYFVLACLWVVAWNWWVIAFFYDVRGHSVEDEDLYRWKDARVSTNFDRTKYNFNDYFFSTHYSATIRRSAAWRDHPEDPRQNWKPQFNKQNPYGLDRYVKYYGYSKDMRLV